MLPSARGRRWFNPRNVAACEVMARLAEVARAPQVLDWRKRIVELAPTVENKLHLASAALRNQPAPFALASQTLDEISATASNRPAYHVIRAEMALKLRHPAQAEAAFSEALRLEPANPMHQLNLAVLRLQSTNAQLAASARAALESLRSSTNLSAIALRWLVADRVSRGDFVQAGKYSSALLAEPGVVLDDRLQHLSILKETSKSEFAAQLQSVQQGSATNPPAVYGVTAWMITHGLAPQALQWITNLPPKIKAEQPVPMAAVDCLVAVADWPALEIFLQEAQWEDIDFLRLAFLSRAASEQKQTLAAESHWRGAVRKAGDRLGPLNALYTMASSWGKTEAREDLLWQITQRFPKERWAFRELDRQYSAEGNTRGLNKLYAALMSVEPENTVVKNNFAATCLLLHQNLPRAHQAAREIYTQRPADPVVSSTYAYSLHIQGRSKEALDILQKIKQEDLEQPGIALYYGAILAANGETNRAGQYLARASKGAMLPEEKALIQDFHAN